MFAIASGFKDELSLWLIACINSLLWKFEQFESKNLDKIKVFKNKVIELEVCHERRCAIHFDGKGGEIKSFTEETLSKMLDVRRHWLSLSAPYKNFTDVAKKSLKLIDDSSNFSLERINEAYGYHLSCYRYFTDISKLQRAKTALGNSSIKRTAQESIDETDSEDPDPATKVARTTRRSLEKETSGPRRSSNILPEICLI